MTLALLAARSDIHTVRWANALVKRGHTVHLISMHSGGDPLDGRVRTHGLFFPAPLGYFFNAPGLRLLLRRIRPDLLHAHFASGYGTLGRLSGYRPYVLSVWGRDVYDFPSRSGLHRRVLTGNLRAADHVCSTSRVMAAHTRSLGPDLPPLTVTPFGIDTDVFAPASNGADGEHIVIGTVKKLTRTYGIDVLIRAFAVLRALLHSADPDTARALRLVIVGGGEEREALRSLAASKGIERVTEFAGPVNHEEVPRYLNRFDVYAALSRTESFGVAVLEASACERPVVVSDVGGLPEVVVDGETGRVVPSENPAEAANALRRLVTDGALRARMGRAGRQHVLARYRWEDSVSIMERVYEQVAGHVVRQSGPW